MKENHTIKNPLKKRSLQWRLTLLITLLDNRHLHSDVLFSSVIPLSPEWKTLKDYVVQINETDSTPITFNI